MAESPDTVVRANRLALLGEPGARRISPFLFLLVVVCFFLAFAGVSCNTDAAKSGLQGLAGAEGVSSADAGAIDSCLDSLKGENVVSYTGWALVFGKDPTITSLPAACDTGTAATAADAGQVNIGPQLLAVLALVAVGLALLCAIAGAFGVARGRSRAFAAVIFGTGSIVLLVLDQLHVSDVLLAKIAASAGSSVPGFNPASYFNVNAGIGLVIAVVVLAVAVLYNIVAMIIGDAPDIGDIASVSDTTPMTPVPEPPPPPP
ncbi:MAG TPA: hypothetical protein VI434_01335 [Candidatus Dormibacteraeota bacterium]